ncbi:MAG: GDSL-type esterase/lipase family protein [Lachnospiraceae bacterium]|nr:GDSL-type esterase/lipase family protein [Lachnospiraceae bacterium]
MKLLLFGDSLTFGYGVWKKDNIETLIKSAYPQWDIINKGVNGDTTREALERFEEDVLNNNPDVITFLFGSNDSAMGEGPYRTVYEYKLNMEKMTEMLLLKNKNAKIIYITPPPVDETVFMPWTYNDRLEPYCNACHNLAEKYNGILVDFNQYLTNLGGKNIAEYLQEDGCHLSEKGYLAFFHYLNMALQTLYKG